MGIYLPNMEMPTGCGAITIHVWPDGQTEVIEQDGEWKTAEAVPVPPHGRLIDADALGMNYIHIRDDGMKIYTQRAIDNAPTIIEAEEG